MTSQAKWMAMDYSKKSLTLKVAMKVKASRRQLSVPSGPSTGIVSSLNGADSQRRLSRIHPILLVARAITATSSSQGSCGAGARLASELMVPLTLR